LFEPLFGLVVVSTWDTCHGHLGLRGHHVSIAGKSADRTGPARL